MNFNEAFNKATDEEFLYSPAAGEMEEMEVAKQGILSGYHVETIRVLRDDWQIIKAKREPVSAEEMFMKNHPEETNTDRWLWYQIGFNESEQNTHLLYDELIKHILDYKERANVGAISRIYDEVDKIKQHRDAKST